MAIAGWLSLCLTLRSGCGVSIVPLHFENLKESAQKVSDKR